MNIFFHTFSLHSNSQLDISIKDALIRDLFNLVGFMIPEIQDVVPNPCPVPDLRFDIEHCIVSKRYNSV